mgnify:CR=1 FL=1
MKVAHSITHRFSLSLSNSSRYHPKLYQVLYPGYCHLDLTYVSFEEQNLLQKSCHFLALNFLPTNPNWLTLVCWQPMTAF